DRSTLLTHLADCESQVQKAGPKKQAARKKPGMGRIPYRIAPLSPTPENTPPPIAQKIRSSKLPAWALFWANSHRTLHDIANALSAEHNKEITPEQVTTYFEAHEQLGYARLIAPEDRITKTRLIKDLKALGLQNGMDVMVHSALSKVGYIAGGPSTLIDALLSVIGKRGTLMMPSFNHRSARVYNPAVTPTTNGALPDAFWRRPDVVRSLQPTHALAATGPKAEALLHNHLQTGLWTAESPLARFIHGGGYILSVGVDHNSSTAYHVAEISVPCGCIDPFGTTDRVVMPDGTVQKVQGLAFRNSTCPVPPGKLNETLNRRKLQQKGKVGNAPTTLVKALDLWKVRRQHLKNACPTCPIKPRYETK
ncbi:MAG: AAC(3) family N-acetyltransferase, partial [bacterium]|nr:AAC(3) family N-acetyltransferase [bacterium]